MSTEIPLQNLSPARSEHESLPDGPGPRTVTSDQLFRGATEVVIDHGGALYRLKITRQGKLILNK